MQNFIDKTKTFDIGRLLTITLTIAPIAICFLGMVFPDSALAAQKDGLETHTGPIETMITGNLLRMAVLVGTVWGAIQAYMSGKFMVLASTLGIGLGTYGILEWAKATWAFVI